MRYNELDYKTTYPYLTLLDWWGAKELAKRRKNGDIYEIAKGEYMRLE